MAGRDFPPSSAMTAQVQRLAINNKWAQAISSGEFEDDDAQMVKGIDAMDDGNMARRRRQQAAKTAFQYVQSSYSASSLPRDQIGQVPPRSRFPGTRQRGNIKVRHDSDEPVDMNATIAAAMRRQAPHRSSGNPASNPAPRPVSSDETRVKNASPPKTALTPTATAAAQNAPQKTQLELPDGASVIVQLPVTMQSAALGKRDERYRANVQFISGRDYKDDKIVFTLDKAEIDDIKYSIGEYCNRMDVDRTALIVQFTTKGKPVFYALDFGCVQGKESFDGCLRGLVDKSKLKQGASGVAIPTTVETPTKTAETSPAASSPVPVVISRASIPPEAPATTEGILPDNAYATTAVAPQAAVGGEAERSTALKTVTQAQVVATAPPQVAGSTISPQLTESQLDEIVVCVIDTAIYMRDCTPDDYSVDVMKSVIRGSTAAFMMKHNPDFALLSARNRAELVEGHWIPAVTDRFFGWLRSAPKENAQQELQKQCLENQELIKDKVRHVYSRVELTALRSSAIDMTHSLPQKKVFEDPNLNARRQQQREADARRTTTSVPSIGGQIQRAASAADWVHNRSRDRSTPKTSHQPAQKLIPTDHVTAKVEPLTKAAACDQDSAQEIADWVFGPKKDEQTKKHTGLNNSIHNLTNADVLGVNSGQFTGVFQSPEFQDLVEIFDRADKIQDKISPLTQEFRRLSLR